MAHIKYTVLLMPNGSDRVTSVPLQALQPTVTLEDPEVKAILNLSYKKSKKSAAKKKGERERLALDPNMCPCGKVCHDDKYLTCCKVVPAV